MHGAHAFLPMFINRLAANAEDRDAETPLITRGDFKTTGINNTVNSVLLAVGDDPVFSNRLYTLCGADINQFHVGPNVELVDVSATQGVEAITENGIIANGKEYAVDCIVYASGFEITSSYERRLGIPIFGVGGKSIYEHWQEGMRTMHGLMVSDFPNLFLCGGGFVFQKYETAAAEE